MVQLEKPKMELQITADGVTATWGPAQGNYAKYAENADAVAVNVKEWWLYVWTTAHPTEQKEPDEPSRGTKIADQSLGIDTKWTIPMSKLSKLSPAENKYVVAFVIGYFANPDGKPILDKNDEEIVDKHGKPAMEGIYSNVASEVIG